MFKFSKLVSIVPSFVLVLSVFSGSTISASAAVPPLPTVSPASAMDSSSNPIFGLDLTSCLEVFNWAQKMADLKAGIAESNPYIKKDCVHQDNIATNGTRTVVKDASGNPTNINYTVNGSSTINKTLYNQLEIGPASTKSEFGNLPVLGVWPNGSSAAQALNAYDIDGTLRGTTATSNRAELSQIGSIYTAPQLNSIFTTGGARTGMPRIPNTGPEKFRIDTNGDPIYQGGYCKTVGGKITIRNVWAGPNPSGQQLSYNVNVGDYGFNPNSPITTCNWPNILQYQSAKVTDKDGLVKEQNLDVYQYVYKVPFPKDKGECDAWFPNSFSTYATCLTWFQQRYSLPLTGSATGNAVYYVYTYYGVWNDIYTTWIGYTNPDLNKARSTFSSNATLAQLRTYYGDDIPALRRLLNDTTSSNSVLIGKINSAPQSTQDQYKAVLKDRFESFIQGADAYSVYAM